MVNAGSSLFISPVRSIWLVRSVLAAMVFAGAVTQAPDAARAGVVSFKQNQLIVDGKAQPQLFGAEIQYFRLRGGPGRNVPRETVIALWNKALDRAREAKMNTLSFYIPWDFHEYAPGKFDFDGTVDEDGDGQPDFPSRDVRTWIKLVEAHGFKNILARPGPYINAEWGFLGFGAIPLWFHELFPGSHARSPTGQRTLLYSYTDPDFRAYARRWLRTVYSEVLKPYIGRGKLITFLQLDNETNYMWQSAFNHDYSDRAKHLYRDYLKSSYGSLTKVNDAHGRAWGAWDDVEPARAPELNLAEDRDWYRFQDETMHEYLHWTRTVWEDMGVREPTVLFTLAESYNAASHGILPHYKFRNDPAFTGMMTVNLYPKTQETAQKPLLNNPFKADHDVKAADAANDFYLGDTPARRRRTRVNQEWAMGPEIQAGWWRGIDVSLEARRQTYLTVLGHGLKAMYLYYFNEGQNWQTSWAKEQILPFYERLRAHDRYKTTPEDRLPETFWSELNEEVAGELMVGWDARQILAQGGTRTPDLYFDAPLGGDAEPRAPFPGVKEIGEKLIAPYGDFLGSAVELTDDVCLIKDSSQHAPSPVVGLDSGKVNADWASGLVGLLLQAGINPRVHHWGLNSSRDLLDPKICKLLIYQDTGVATPEFVSAMRTALKRGASLLSFLDDHLSSALTGARSVGPRPAGRAADADADADAAAPADSAEACRPLPEAGPVADGTRCPVGRGFVYHVKTPIYEAFNTDDYGTMQDVPARRAVLESILRDLGVVPKLRLREGGDRTAVFGRTSPDGRKLMVTVKTGRADGSTDEVTWRLADRRTIYTVTDVFSGTRTQIDGKKLAEQGFRSALPPNGSAVYFIAPAGKP